jgi:hypothetical protein
MTSEEAEVMAPPLAAVRLCAFHASANDVWELLSHSSVVRKAFRDASSSSESASGRIEVGAGELEARLLVRRARGWPETVGGQSMGTKVSGR